MPVNAPTLRDIERRLVLRLGGELVPVTDLTPISVARQLIRAWVEEYGALWRGLVESQNQWFLQTASGDDLDRRLADFGIETRPGSARAYGLASITTSADINLTPGTVLRTVPTDGTNPKRYQVKPNQFPNVALGDVGDSTWHVTSGNSRLVDIEALDDGEAGNTSAKTIIEAENPIASATALTNPSAIANGRDPFGDAETREWFVEWLRSLAGGTRGAIAFALRNFVDPVTNRRAHSFALQEWDGAALLRSAGGKNVALLVYVDEGIGAPVNGAATADSAFVAAVQRLLDGTDTEADPGHRAAGVPVAAQAATARLINMDLNVDVDAAFNVETVTRGVQSAIHAHVTNLPVGGRLITGELQGQVVFSRLFKAVLDVNGVLRAEFNEPKQDQPIPIGFKAVVGTLVVTTSVV